MRGEAMRGEAMPVYAPHLPNLAALVLPLLDGHAVGEREVLIGLEDLHARAMPMRGGGGARACTPEHAWGAQA